ncbi:PEP-CTERM sorting domain-containing protein [Marinobacter sp. JSM 1782161]|uniref:PEP-CTERM sorting domain-containing protein n=1 Tax=Marinobacter sp. JSM 1782161 TaxID=2685906 RepID=UPI0014039D89|nr:PEP-CTERM sorting domain-containing protein [Marinobacter sp. JSM 1782161]
MKMERILGLTAGVALGVAGVASSANAALMLSVSGEGEAAAQAAESAFFSKLKSGYLTEGFESYTAGTGSQANTISTSVGDFTQDVAGTGGSCDDGGFSCSGGVAILDAGSTPFFGRSAVPTGPDNDNWLDSMDSQEMTFSVLDGYNAVGFYITDPNDEGGYLTVSGMTFSYEALFGSSLDDGQVFYVSLIDTDGLGEITFYSNNESDGYGIDNVTVGEVPEPGTLALLGLGLAGVGVMRRRKA